MKGIIRVEIEIPVSTDKWSGIRATYSQGVYDK